MKELKRIVEDIQSVFAESSYPQEFLDAYDQMECLASHSGRETFLVQRKDTGQPAVAKCYDRAVFPYQPDYSLLADLDHPGLPRFRGQYQNERMLCIVREYIEGEPLSDRARETAMSQEEILSVTDQLCGILEALHGHNPPIIHRDIKPENVILRADGTAVLIDFDISRSFKERGQTDTVFFGTKGYAAPEQYGFGQTDSRTDIFALGVLLRWLMTGSIRENKNITINADVQRIIDHCTAFAPDERYAERRRGGARCGGRAAGRGRLASLAGLLTRCPADRSVPGLCRRTVYRVASPGANDRVCGAADRAGGPPAAGPGKRPAFPGGPAAGPGNLHLRRGSLQRVRPVF